MSKTAENISGKIFNNLMVLSDGHKNESNKRMVTCKCLICGKIVDILRYNVVNGHSKSCGCLTDIKRHERATHGLSYTRIYSIYNDMIRRCYDSSNSSYYRYGGRGITVCDEWYDPTIGKLDKHKLGNPWFMNFYNWAISNGYSDELSIDRKDNDGPYAPWNCQWVNFNTQCNNRRTTRTIFDSEEELSHRNFERKYNLKRFSVHGKEAHGWSYNAIVFAAKHPELGIRKMRNTDKSKFNYGPSAYIDKDGFQVLIPKI